MTQDMVKMMSQDKMIGKREILSSSPSTWFSRFLRTMLLLLMLTLGVGEIWGQTDYSGFYYIANYTRDNSKAKGYVENDPAGNYYLCPAALYYNDDPEMPYLTTKRTNQGANSIWELRKVPETSYYYIIHYEEGGNGRYLVHNAGPISDKENRFRVHLEANPTLANNNNVLFTITNSNGTFKIRPNADNSDRSLNPASGNKDSYTPFGNENIGGTTYATGGIIGLWKYSTGADDAASRWYLEKAAPIIRYNSESTIKITYPDPAASIYYSFGEDSTPSPSTEGTLSYTGPFDLPSGTTTIKAIAVNGDKQSGIATYKLPFLLGSTHKYIIQSENCQFYRLIPNVSVDDNKYLSTLNVPCSTMAWHFEYAEDFYYYIVDENGWYMYYTTTDNTNKYIYLKNSKDNDDDGFKFNIEFHANGGYNIMPKGQALSIYKNNYGSNDAGLKPVMYDGTIIEDVARWDIRPYSTTNLPMWEDQPFTVSTDEETNYYNIVSVSTSKPIILNNSGDVKSEEVPTSDYDERKAMWVIKKVGSDTDGLLDYYTLQNAYTGDYLYYNGKGRNIVESVLQLGLPTTEGVDATWSHFVIVQTANGYNIIPRPIVDNTKAINRTSKNEGFNCINRRGGGDVLGTFYDDGDGSRWTFSLVDTPVKCMNPVFTEKADGSIEITSITNAAKIRYSITNADPTATSEEYTTQLNTSNQVLIKAIAIIGDDMSSASDVVTLLNKPGITLPEITYNGTAQEPEVTKVSIGETGSETVAPLRAYSASSYGGDNINAGTDAATVTLSDADATDLWCIWNAATTFSIGKAPLTITPTANLSKVYGEDDPTLTYSSSIATTSGLYDTDAFAGALGRAEGENVGSYAINQGTLKVTRESTDVSTNYDITIADESFTVTARPITISGITASEKTYDGNTTASLVYTDVTYGNIKDGDKLTVTATGTFDSKDVLVEDNVVKAKTVTISDLALGGTDAANYILATSGQQDEATANINPKPLTITNVAFTASGKTYDGTTDAVFESIDYSQATIEGVLDGDNLTIVSATGTFDNKNVGTDKTVTITGFTFAGTDAANYTYNGGDLTAKAGINAKSLTITGGISGVDKEYDGTTAAELDFTSATFAGMIVGDNLSASGIGTFDSKDVLVEDNVVKAKTVTISGLTLVGVDAGNYELTASGHQETTTATISKKIVTISGVTANDKTYDGTIDATLDYTNQSIVGVVAGENLTVVTTAATGKFDTKDVGPDKTVTISGLAIDGTDVSNYVLSAEAPTTTANITPAVLIVTPDEGQLKEYHAVEPTLTYKYSGLATGDNIDAVLTGALTRFPDGYDALDDSEKEQFENVRSYNILIGTLAIVDGNNNYTLTFNTMNTSEEVITFAITPKSLTDASITTSIDKNEGGDYIVTVKDGTKVLSLKESETDTEYDYSLAPVAEGDAGYNPNYYKVTITGNGNYKDDVAAKYALTHFMNDGQGGTEWSATFVAEEDHALPTVEDVPVTAYVITAISGNTVTPQELNFIPGPVSGKSVPVLLLYNANPDNNNAPSGFKVEAPTVDLTDISTLKDDNMLEEVTEASEGYVPETQLVPFEVATIYLLYRNEFVLNKAGNLAKGRVYLNPNHNAGSGDPSPARLMILWGEETGIKDAMQNDNGQKTNDKWYAIDGRRLNGKPTKKGLYIKNGQKAVVK